MHPHPILVVGAQVTGMVKVEVTTTVLRVILQILINIVDLEVIVVVGISIGDRP